MSAFRKSLTAGVSLALLTGLAAAAADIDNPTARIDNDQTSYDADIWSFSGNESESALAATAVGIALGNTASATTSRDVSLQADNFQDLTGVAESHAHGYLGEAGTATADSVTYGNSFTAETGDAEAGMNSEQNSGGGWLRSRALLEVASYADSAVATATTGANTATLSAQTGYAGLDAIQSNSSDVFAESEIEAYDADVLAAVGTAVAVINNANVSTRGDADLFGDQYNEGDGLARTTVRLGGAYAGIGTATITGNNLNLGNHGGVGNLDATQTNTGDLSAESFVQMSVFPGQGSSTTVAAGNSASAATTGPSTGINIVQNNTGGVNSDALLSGGAGFTGAASATAYGNAATGALCNCDGAMTARNVQTNSGPVSARAYTFTGTAGVMTATSVAAGNTATYTVGEP